MENLLNWNNKIPWMIKIYYHVRDIHTRQWNSLIQPAAEWRRKIIRIKMLIRTEILYEYICTSLYYLLTGTNRLLRLEQFAVTSNLSNAGVPLSKLVMVWSRTSWGHEVKDFRRRVGGRPLLSKLPTCTLRSINLLFFFNSFPSPSPFHFF